MRRSVPTLLLLAAVSTASAQHPVPCDAQPHAIACPCSPTRLWFQADYLLWWIKNDQTPGPLVTTGPAGDPRQGVRGNPTTGTLFDGSQLDYRGHSGIRLAFGGWLDPCAVWGLEAAGFALETHTIHGESNSNRTTGAPVIARPFINALTGQEDAQVITSPQDPLGGRYLGGIDVFADSRLWGGELNLIHALSPPNEQGGWALLAGFRYLGLKDELRFSQSSTVLIAGAMGFGGAAAPPPDIVSVTDFFETNNHFYGGQLGLRGHWCWGRWTLDVETKAGLGATHQKVWVGGWTSLTDPTGATLREPGGLYALRSNMGDRSDDRLSFITENSVHVGCQVLPRLRLWTGWSILYWDEVARPGRQIDRQLDPRQIPSNLAYNPAITATQPAPRVQSTDFWAHGLSVGLEVRY